MLIMQSVTAAMSGVLSVSSHKGNMRQSRFGRSFVDTVNLFLHYFTFGETVMVYITSEMFAVTHKKSGKEL